MGKLTAEVAIRHVCEGDFCRDFMKRAADDRRGHNEVQRVWSATYGRSGWILLGGSSFANRWLRQQGRDLHEVVGEHSRRDPQFKALAAFGKTAFHSATAEQHRDAPLDACPKALAVLELRTLLVGFA